jgi:hypothetical protein
LCLIVVPLPLGKYPFAVKINNNNNNNNKLSQAKGQLLRLRCKYEDNTIIKHKTFLSWLFNDAGVHTV